MKRPSRTVILLFGFCLLLTACTDEKNVAPQGSSTIFQPLTSTKSVEKKVNVPEVQKSIQVFHAANGRYPADLNEVAAFNGMRLESDKYVYDPVAGTLTERP